MVKATDHDSHSTLPSSYGSLIVLPLFFILFPLFTFDYSFVDEIVFGRRQLTVYLHKPPVKDPVEIDKYCPLLPKSLGRCSPLE